MRQEGGGGGGETVRGNGWWETVRGNQWVVGKQQAAWTGYGHGPTSRSLVCSPASSGEQDGQRGLPSRVPYAQSSRKMLAGCFPLSRP